MENKKEIKKAFDGLTDDVLDHYTDYSIKHKIMVKDQLNSFKKLNEILSVYDDKMQKNEIRKEFDRLRDDILDHYDSYTSEHKKLVLAELEKYKSLNNELDFYDNPKEIEKKKSFWEILFQAFGIKK